jgi:hypothetical protein
MVSRFLAVVGACLMMTFEQELQISYVANDTAIKPDKVL